MNTSKANNKSILKVFWYRHPSNNGNYGDELGPFIIERLSGHNIEYFDICRFSNASLDKSKLIRSPRYLISSLKNILIRKGWGPKVIVSVGSIIAWFDYRNAHVWGSGVLKATDRIYKSNFYAVRGKYTKEIIKKAGYDVPSVLGDPGLLISVVYNPIAVKKYRIGLIPHYIHYKELKEKITDPSVLVIDLLGSVEEVTGYINSCELTLSSSLHGLIVSHSYRIPALWVSWSDKELAGDNIKFKDYFSAVNIPSYKPFPIFDQKVLNDPKYLEKLVKENYNLSEPKIEKIQEIQKELICHAPFPVSSQYKMNR